MSILDAEEELAAEMDAGTIELYSADDTTMT